MRFAIAGVGSDGDLFLRSHDTTAKIVYVDSPVEALTLLEKGEIDATMLSRLTVYALIEKLHLRNVVELRDPAAYIDHHSRFAVHKGDTVLLSRLNEGLAILQRSGEYDRIYRKWLGRYEPAHFTREQVISYVALALALALLVAVWTGYRQHRLRRRIAGQAGELLEQRELLRALHDNVPLAMGVFDLSDDGPRLCSLNPRAVECLGLDPAVAIGQRLENLDLSPDWVNFLEDVTKKTRRSGRMMTEEYVVASSQQCYVVTSVLLAPRLGGVPRLCVLLEDVTDRRRMDQEIAQSRRLRAVGELVGGIAHEFNNLMTPVVLKVGEVQMDYPDNVILQQDMAVIGTAVGRAAE
jgi:PAS domain S-box-containing protein